MREHILNKNPRLKLMIGVVNIESMQKCIVKNSVFVAKEWIKVYIDKLGVTYEEFLVNDFVNYCLLIGADPSSWNSLNNIAKQAVDELLKSKELYKDWGVIISSEVKKNKEINNSPVSNQQLSFKLNCEVEVLFNDISKEVKDFEDKIISKREKSLFLLEGTIE